MNLVPSTAQRIILRAVRIMSAPSGPARSALGCRALRRVRWIGRSRPHGRQQPPPPTNWPAQAAFRTVRGIANARGGRATTQNSCIWIPHLRGLSGYLRQPRSPGVVGSVPDRAQATAEAKAAGRISGPRKTVAAIPLTLERLRTRPLGRNVQSGQPCRSGSSTSPCSLRHSTARGQPSSCWTGGRPAVESNWSSASSRWRGRSGQDRAA